MKITTHRNFLSHHTAFFTILFLFSLSTGIIAQEPIPSRKWTSTAGTTIEAEAKAVNDGKVQLVNAAGRKITVPLEKLIAADRDLINKHFQIAAKEPAPDAVAGEPQLLSTELYTNPDHPTGEVIGPILAKKEALPNKEDQDRGDLDEKYYKVDSNYYFYIPKSLIKNRKAPLLMVTQAGGGGAGKIKRYIEGAELTSSIIAISVESSNKNSGDYYNKKIGLSNRIHALKTIIHLRFIKNLPVDLDRVFYTGGSGGGVAAMNLAAFPLFKEHKPAGVMPEVSHYHDHKDKLRNCHLFVLNGTLDYNRYFSADIAKEQKSTAIQRYHIGGHTGCPEWLATEGLTWLYGRFLAAEDDEKYDDDRLDYQARVISYINKIRETDPHHAYYLCEFLSENFKLQGHNGNLLNNIKDELAKDSNNVRYAEGIAEIDKFAKSEYAGNNLGSSHKHSIPAASKKALKLAEKFEGVPEIPELLKSLAEKTQ